MSEESCDNTAYPFKVVVQPFPKQHTKLAAQLTAVLS